MRGEGCDQSGASSGDTCAGAGRRWKECPLTQELFILHNLMMRTGDRLVADLGLTSSRWLLLGALEQYDEPPTVTELSANGLLSVQNVSRMVAAMEADGLLERFTRRGAGRATFVRMTPKGRRIKERTEERARAFAARFLDGLSDKDKDRAQGYIDRMIANLEALEADLCERPKHARGVRNGSVKR